MRHYIKILIALVFVSSMQVQGQDKGIKKGNDEFQDFAYVDAREAYLKVAEDGYQDEDLLKRLADSYYYTAEYKKAAKWYGALYDTGNKDADYLYRYALSLKSDQSYVASDEIMEEFLNIQGEEYRAKLFLNERNYLEEIELQSGRFALVEVGFNSELSDFAPAFHQGNLVFASNGRTRHATKRVHDWNDQPFLNLHKVGTEEGVTSKGVKEFSKELNTKYHESTATFTKDGNTVYFTRNNYTAKDYKEDEAGTNRLKLYRGKRDSTSTDWKVEELPFNSDEYSTAHPALSIDEKTLYFASDRPGGKGLSDLYKTSIEGEGFGAIVSLGDNINTEGRETFPFISKKDRLYFASDGHVGLGGLDVFVTDITGTDTFGDVFNVGRPINGPMDDFTFIIKQDGIGYFASNRDGGVGDDDIYSFRNIKPLITKLNQECEQNMLGTVLDEKTDLPIADAIVTLLDADGNKVDSTVSAYDGSFRFDTIACSTQYSVRSEKPDFSTAEKPFATGKTSGTTERTLFMKKGKDLGATPAPRGSDLVKILGLNMIYFDLDKSFIRTDAAIELRKVIAVMNLYPEMRIDVRSHTDSRSPDDYNMSLSDRRAKSTIEYLTTVGGIDRSRLEGRGYGETQHVNRCSNNVKCSETEHQLNRRSEFIIL